MKAIKGLIITLIVIVALAGVTIIGGYIYVRSTYGIDLFRTAGQLKTLSQTPDEKTLCPNAFSANDMADVKTAMDKNLNGLISYNEGEGYEGYKVDFSAITSPMPFADEIVFSSKQAGALAQTIFFGQTGGVVKIGEKELSVRLVQMDFANVSENGSADFNVVAKVNLKPFKDEMNDFPFSLFKKYVPDELYVSSTVRVEKTDDKMGYSVAHKELKLNNLSADAVHDAGYGGADAAPHARRRAQNRQRGKYEFANRHDGNQRFDRQLRQRRLCLFAASPRQNHFQIHLRRRRQHSHCLIFRAYLASLYKADLTYECTI